MSSPARRQYLAIKAQHPDALLAYQIGDFFEFFDDDAAIVARELQIVLTTRAHGQGEVSPLAGVPVHAVDAYVARLVARGYRVAVCEQVGPVGRGLVERAVTRVLTPGTVVEPGILPTTRDNYLVALAFGRHAPARDALPPAALAYVDASSGAFACAQWPGEALPDALRAELARLAPAEVLIAEGQRPPALDDLAAALAAATVTTCPAHTFEPEGARVRLCRHFSTPILAPFGCEHLPLATAAAGAILAYLERVNPAVVRLLTALQSYDTQGFVAIDGRTWRALEVVEPARARAVAVAPGGGGTGTAERPVTLLAVLDATRTAMGARLLRRTLLQPLTDRATLEARLDAVAELHARPALRERAGAALDGLGDVERLIARVVRGSALPRELLALAAALERVPALARVVRGSEAAVLGQLGHQLDGCEEARALIARAIPPDATSGRLIQPGYDADLDELVRASADARRWIAALEGEERTRTGIRSLKVGYNKVFGYYLEVSRSNLARAPADYQRRQTIAGGERFVTAALKEHEAVVLHAE